MLRNLKAKAISSNFLPLIFPLSLFELVLTEVDWLRVSLLLDLALVKPHAILLLALFQCFGLKYLKVGVVYHTYKRKVVLFGTRILIGFSRFNSIQFLFWALRFRLPLGIRFLLFLH